jgi:hypothetical protein
MDSLSIFKDPWIAGLVLILPVVIIGLAKSWKKFKEKREGTPAAPAAQTDASSTTTPTTPS